MKCPSHEKVVKLMVPCVRPFLKLQASSPPSNRQPRFINPPYRTPQPCHFFRNLISTHLLEDGYDIRTVQELLGHKDVQTTMIYTYVLNRGGKGVRSPMDSL